MVRRKLKSQSSKGKIVELLRAGDLITYCEVLPRPPVFVYDYAEAGNEETYSNKTVSEQKAAQAKSITPNVKFGAFGF